MAEEHRGKYMEEIKRAKVWLVVNQPFFSQVVLDIPCVPETGGTATLSTDGESIYFNPEFTASLQVEELAGAMCHEIMHNLLFHLPRRKERIAGLWNLAADIAVNNDLLDAGLRLPPGSITHRAYRDMSAEEIYSVLMQQYGDFHRESGDGDQGGRPGSVSRVLARHKASEEMLSEAHARWSSAPDPADGSGEPEGGWLEKLFQGMGAAKRGEGRGAVPAGCRRMVDSLTAPRVSWKGRLAEAIDDYLKMEEYEPARPNLKYVSGNLHLPSLKADAPRLVVAAVDTSASIARELLTLFLSELSGLLEEVGEVELLAFDARAHRVARLGEGEGKEEILEKLELTGGGGTDFVPVFGLIEEEAWQPEAVVVFTDLKGRFPDRPPDYPTIWVVPGESREAPPFGEVIGIPGSNGS